LQKEQPLVRVRVFFSFQKRKRRESLFRAARGVEESVLLSIR